MSFKVIDVGSTGKLVSSACYDKQQVCTSMYLSITSYGKQWWTCFARHLVALIRSLYDNQRSNVKIHGDTSGWFSAKQGVRQGCILSPYLFNLIAELLMRYTLEGFDGGFRIGGRRITNLQYADRAGGTGPVGPAMAGPTFGQNYKIFVSTRHISGPQNFRSLLLEGF